ncbi:T9SS type A sorting domain-containing protein [Maribellus maritimus]|uniref:T9SS type A sorting domain-containing protein n=1 Tax=Maribellus maritimus TaxID=2870838 RepID=UPI001EEB5855|nr:T9SS type A sorting domain-containing protein [Maribellus maritimus]MCG6187694.1 T9SS type A sorting domain-containing protein [Maribellus maritimus]
MENYKIKTLIIIFLLFTFLNDLKAQNLIIKDIDGTTKAIQLSWIKKIAFSSGKLKIQTLSNENLNFTTNQIKLLSFNDNISNSISRTTNYKSLFDCYPNPAMSILYLKINSPVRKNVEVKIIDLNGIRHFNKEFRILEPYIKIDLSSLLDGIYFIQVNNYEIIESKTIIKQ